MKCLETPWMQGMIRMCGDGFRQGWHERNGGNLSYRIPEEAVEEIRDQLRYDQPWLPIGAEVKGLAGEFFAVTGSGKYMRNVELKPESHLAIIEISPDGLQYRIVWGLTEGGRPTSELPTHLMNHEVKKRVTQGRHRVIYHAHPANLIALTFLLPLDSAVFTRELWEMATECPVVFPEGLGVVKWMVPGGKPIAEETSVFMEQVNAVVWAHHGLFCSGTDFDETFGLMHTIEKSAEILIKVLSVSPNKRQTITTADLIALAADFHVTLNPEALHLYDEGAEH
ncbi:rhamnulose-1-phosphate aldolase [Holdemania massiliensis]|uniref:rhamnulose-1-phosphate aldolase n=1 Tax=Holdemania massiliensis TaxID=1468449 RepID=UPI001F057109|nr:rhamnulose-1-phosphate aldolase [Holdemania massiliensis]MCH1940098.1 rhamnulose-1-phosphate aldolase [Holdemania massiliensis]